MAWVIICGTGLKYVGLVVSHPDGGTVLYTGQPKDNAIDAERECLCWMARNPTLIPEERRSHD